ncbi:undecaprenyldiphospho-muramoylpentapeptide beta-N-acetylglucosaminyltransferase [Bermanella marisrubri]|uniref:UDP-N-acetylglucosamine--N-acetylmuramyl-(pentapeptide) pyrophosphoryl-undecaprenol N-acetylglucosamine transferase n=1 Tax=Bermanella marisrubri TaxID=207949 RepID=Q1MYC0_9GAMM|nr:undecaprenyldiphospho-muramoylpentapeptide beta-N-acetylglucosaminyltransferase [Bermanella marisrubri]EAT10947.1 N-acetylglucosaminyl transferase [Oceanobacter sp. RED65] [Bermanella marisrubri]QIZ85095.1 undecaprenyldiphospho-muramoylpentapeptide beta-N-acetylglucosaminyltransferase [Bermanella marisrubri]
MSKGNVMIMAGGTGGHVIPALSVATELREKGYKIHWLGSEHGIENDLVPDAGYSLHRIQVTGLRGNGLVRKLKAPFAIAKAVVQAYKLFKDIKPVVALGMGGFASGPGGIVARLRGVPLVLHEQNAIPGLTNKVLSKFSRQLLQAFDGTFPHSAGVKTVGNPVRSSIANLPDAEDRISQKDEPLNVLVVGGSLGAVALNDAVIAASEKLVADGIIQLWHQVGKRNYEAVKNDYHEKGIKHVRVAAFIADMAEAYQWADIVICRSGALTVSELMAGGVASILVPFPYAVDDHQTANARFLSEHNAAVLCPQAELTTEFLQRQLTHFFSNKQELIAMANAAREKAQPNAAKVVASICIEVANG